jgi:rRNA maturation endonuclease Nob1
MPKTSSAAMPMYSEGIKNQSIKPVKCPVCWRMTIGEDNVCTRCGHEKLDASRTVVI